MKKRTSRYIYDPLYGPIYLPDYVWDVIPCAELQRLREVRLCNINSLCLIGGSNISRYEHAIGTCHLAQECLDSWPALDPISLKEKRHLMLAALLHDVASAAFGHSVEYIESKEGFNHEKAFEYVVGKKSSGGSYQYQSATFDPIFFGLREILSHISEEDVDAISEIISGKGKFGPLINGSIDLDNIDNVFRLAYHIGIVKSREVPLKLAASIWINEGTLIVRSEAVPLVEEWFKLRRKLYNLLLLNPEEFSAKCMLHEAIEIAKCKDANAFKWWDVDYDLIKKLSNTCAESSIVISRLMKGDLYGCIGIFSTNNIEAYKELNNLDKRKEHEGILSDLIREFGPQFKSAMISLHSIIDVNKTERQIQLKTDKGNFIQVGKSSNQVLIGVFFKNINLNMYKLDKLTGTTINKMRREISKYLSSKLGDENLMEINLYDEVKECK
jgi:hypothetical protein